MFPRRTALAALVAIAAVACSSHSTPTQPDGQLRIRVEDNRFSPSTLAAAAGSTINWTWAGANLHSVTFDDGPGSPVQIQGSYERAFSAPGTYAYHCTIHGLAMAGTVTIQ